jgi:hypothetical protein
MNSSTEEEVKLTSDYNNRGNQEPELLVCEQLKERSISSTNKSSTEDRIISSTDKTLTEERSTSSTYKAAEERSTSSTDKAAEERSTSSTYKAAEERSTPSTYKAAEERSTSSTYKAAEERSTPSTYKTTEERSTPSTDKTTVKEPRDHISNSAIESIAEENAHYSSDNHNCKVPCDYQSLDIESLKEVVNKQPIVKTAEWISEAPISKLSVTITDRASFQLQKFSKTAKNPDFKLKFLHSSDEALDAIKSILCEDPRSIYRRQKCKDSLYYFTVDTLHVTCWFDDNIVEILKVQPILYAQHLKVS